MMTMNQRFLTINCCHDCPFFDENHQDKTGQSGEQWCHKLDIKLVDPDNIPDACPLPADMGDLQVQQFRQFEDMHEAFNSDPANFPGVSDDDEDDLPFK